MADKMLKKDMFLLMRTFIPKGHEYESELISFIDSQITALDIKKEKCRERAAARKALGDDLKAMVEATLTYDWQTIADIMVMIGDESITRAKVSARLGVLVKEGTACKICKIVDGKRTMHYKLLTEEDLDV